MSDEFNGTIGIETTCPNCNQEMLVELPDGYKLIADKSKEDEDKEVSEHLRKVLIYNLEGRKLAVMSIEVDLHMLYNRCNIFNFKKRLLALLKNIEIKKEALSSDIRKCQLES